MEHKYQIYLYWSEDDDAFIAEVPELAGCMAQGKSYQEAREKIEVEIEAWMQSAIDDNRPIPTPRWGADPRASSS